jgi:hypothetical protein
MGTEYESRLQQMLDDVGSFVTRMHEVAVAQAEKTSTSGTADAPQQPAKRARRSVRPQVTDSAANEGVSE